MTPRKKEPELIGDVLNAENKARENNVRAVIATSMIEMSRIETAASGLEIKDNASLKLAAETVSIAQKLGKALEAKRTELTKPLLDEKAVIDRRFREVQDRLEAIKRAMINKIDIWNAAERRRIQAEEEERRLKAMLEAETAREDLGITIPDSLLEEEAPAVQEPPRRIETTTGGVQERKMWRWRLVDKAKVPEELKLVNEVAINKLVREGTREIPGLEIYQETITVAI